MVLAKQDFLPGQLTFILAWKPSPWVLVRPCVTEISLPVRIAVTVTQLPAAWISDRMMAEILGRADGYCRGKGGSMHITDISRGMLGADGIVGGGIPIAVGAALGMRLKASSSVVFCFFGEGAATRERSTKLSIWPRSIVSPYCLSAKTTYGRSVPLPKKRPPGAVSPIGQPPTAYLDIRSMEMMLKQFFKRSVPPWLAQPGEQGRA